MLLKNDRFIALLLGLLAFAIYANGIDNGYNLDDELVTNHQHLTTKGITAVPDIFSSYYFDNQVGNQYEYRPVVLASFALEHTIFDESPTTSHAINVLLYALSIMLLYLVLRAVLPGNNFAPAFITTLLFALHPLHTEVVDSIKNRDELLCFLGGIGALYFAHRFVLATTVKAWGNFGLFAACFAFGLLSKRSILSYAFLIPIMLLWLQSVRYTKLLALSVALAIGCYLMSPTSSKYLNILALGTIMCLPLVLQYAFYDFRWPTFKQLVSNPFSPSNQPINANIVESAKQFNKDQAFSALLTNPLVWLFALLTIGFVVVLLVTNNYYLQLGLVAIIITLSIVSPVAVRQPFLLISILLCIVLSLWHNAVEPLRLISYAILALLYISDKWNVALLLVGLVNYMVIFLLQVQTGQVLADIFPFLFQLSFLALKPKKLSYTIAIALLVIALISYVISPFKPIYLVVPIISSAIMLLIWWEKPSKYLAPALMLLSLPLVFFMQRDVLPNNNSIKTATTQLKTAEQRTIPSAGRELDFVENPLIKYTDFNHKSATAFTVVGKYMQLLIVPYALCFYYGYNQIPITDWGQVMPWLMILFVISTAALSFYYRKRYPIITLGTLYLLLSILFISNLTVLMAGIVAERIAYVGSLGFSLLLAGVFVAIYHSTINHWGDFKRKPLLTGGLLLLLTLYIARTVVRNEDWADRLTLFAHDVKDAPNSAKANQLLGFEFLLKAEKEKDHTRRHKQIDAGRSYLARSLELAPDFNSPVFNMAFSYALDDNCDGAIPWLQRSIKISPNEPEWLYKYAVCLENKNKLTEAAQTYQMAIKLSPKNIDYYNRLGYIYYRLGNLPQSLKVNLDAILNVPKAFDPYINAAKIYMTQNDYPSALPLFIKAFQLHSDNKGLAITIADLSNRVGNLQQAQQYNQIAANLKGR